MKKNIMKKNTMKKGALQPLAGKIERKGGRCDPILAHFSPEELANLDKIQGGTRFNPKTKLREYDVKIDEYFTSPQIQKLLQQSPIEEMEEREGFAQGGEVDEIEDAGRGEDSMLAHLTHQQAQIFDQMQGGPSFNPRTGLREYGRIKRLVKKASRGVHQAVHQPGRRVIKPLVRIAAPIAGAMAAGPVGAGAGSFLANKATGKNTKGALKAGLLSGLAAYALPQLGGAFSSAFPETSAGLGNLSTGLIGGGPTSFLGNLLGGGAASGAENIAGAAGSRAAGEIGKNILTGGASAATQSAGGAAGGGLAGLFGGLLGGGAPGGGGGGLLSAPALAMGGLGLLSLRSAQNKQRKERERYNREVAAIEGGMYDLDPSSRERREVGPLERNYVPYAGDYNDYQGHQFFNDVNPPVSYLAEGGAIKSPSGFYFEGRGGGQDDDIPTTFEEGGYVIPADVTSDMGDGNSKRGSFIFDEFFEKGMRHEPNRSLSEVGKKVRAKIPAKVSAGEYYIPPAKVDALGRGNNKKGTGVLNGFLKNVRAHKATKDHPPKAKTISQYMKAVRA